MIIRQQHAAFSDTVDAMCLSCAFIEDKMPPGLFLIRQHLHQDEVADDGIMHFGIVECLIFVFDKFAVDASTRCRVVFDFDREVAADGLDKNTILNADVRMLAVAIHVTSSLLPGELLRRGKNELVVAAVAEVFQRALFIIDEPLECFPRSVTMYNLGLKKQKEQVVAVDFYQKKFEY